MDQKGTALWISENVSTGLCVALRSWTWPTLRLMDVSIDRLYPPTGQGFGSGTDHVPDLMAAISAEHRPPHADRPWVLTNMISSLDGATTVDGVSGGLGKPADTHVFAALRAVADVIIVGAATARSERYKRPRPNPAAVEARLARGQQASPRLAIVSGSLSLPLDLPAFDSTSPTGPRPLVFTGSASSPKRRSQLAELADIEVASTSLADPRWILERLLDQGMRIAMLEGGPSLNGQFAAAGCIDEWNLTLSPTLVSGQSARPAHGESVVPPTELTLTRLWTGDGLLFGRWVATNPSAAAP